MSTVVLIEGMVKDGNTKTQIVQKLQMSANMIIAV